MRQPKKTGAKPKAAGAKDAPKVSARDKRKYIDYKIKVKKGDPLPSFREDAIRLNKFLSNAGICSRREADVLIDTGVVSINGVIVTEMGYKVSQAMSFNTMAKPSQPAPSAMFYSINLKATLLH